MHLSQSDLENQKRLKRELQDARASSELEKLVAALLGRLLGVPIAVARPGSQHGGDAGPAGQQERRFRVECKKYGETSHLRDRELLGEIDQALARDEALEAWVLVATISVPEQLGQDLIMKGERIGVPVLILDWRDSELAPLAALCTIDPDLVQAEFSNEAATLVRLLQRVSADAIAMLRRNLESWCLGFQAIRTRSHEKLDAIWNNPRASNAELGQNAAGGSEVKKVKRAAVDAALSVWWQGPASTDAPAAVVGWDGVGKTWATMDWLMGHKSEQPIVLIVPSSGIGALSAASEMTLRRFLADRLCEVSGVRDSEHWLRRLHYLLKRPTNEGPVLTVFFDGLNQEPSFPWVSMLKILQGGTFSGRVRVVLSTRTHYFDDKLSKLRGLVEPAIAVSVDVYDTTPGGELDQMLAFERLVQKDLQPDLIEMARSPRLFRLVVRLRERLPELGQVNVHMLLWEYGRDTLGERSGKSFTETDWQAWLQEIATRHRAGVREISARSMGKMVSRPDLSAREVYTRLSDIIDSRFVSISPSGTMRLIPTVVAHALGAALLVHLDESSKPTFSALDYTLAQWLDPIAGLEERAEILRAAVSILVEKGCATSPLTGVLVTAWLQTQNMPDGHRRELLALAPHLTEALLDAMEHSDSSSQTSARRRGVTALRAIPRTDAASLARIVERARKWFSFVSRNVDWTSRASPEFEKRRSEHFERIIGVDSSGPRTIVGVGVELVDQASSVLRVTVPSIIEGFPLASARPLFETAAVALAINDRDEGWNGLRWLCLLNEVDPGEAAQALRELSEDMRRRVPEGGVHPELPARIAALLLCLGGEERDEDTAASIDPPISHSFSYEKDYLLQPGRSFFFPLERRHAVGVLTDTELPLFRRVERTKKLWLDPGFEPPADFIAETRASAAGIDVDMLGRHSGRTVEDHKFEELEPVLARCAPDLLANLIRRRMQGFARCPEDSRYCAITATEFLLLAGEPEIAAARTLRMGTTGPNETSGVYAASQLLMIELRDLGAEAQFDELIRADLKYISTDFSEVLRAPASHEVDALIARYGAGTAKKQADLLALLSFYPIEFGDNAWGWIAGFAKQGARDLQGLAFRTLTTSDAARFGRKLATEGWSWTPDVHPWVNHYGTRALIEATRDLPFDQVAPRLAPWRLLEAVRLRGTDPSEVRLAAAIFSHIFMAENIAEPDPGSDVRVDRAEQRILPFVFSISPRPDSGDAKDIAAALEAALDVDAQIKAYGHATKIAAERIQEARQSGASLYLAGMDPEDFVPVLKLTPGVVDCWLQGVCESTADFQRRVVLAEGTFLALCEALLAHDPERGAQLWRVLSDTIRTRYSGAAGIDDLLHMIFRVPDSPAVVELREQQVELAHCNTDKALFEFAVAASYNGKADWLAAIIERDRASGFVWRRKRAVATDGFTANNVLPVKGAWARGQIKTGHVALDRNSARRRWNEACAHHWWKVYLRASDPEEAYAAWVLFQRSADIRAWIWMAKEASVMKDASALFELKLAHAKLSRSRLKNAMEKREEKLGETFLGRKIVEGLSAWGKEPDPPLS